MNFLERIFGPPMAACEDIFQRVLRYWLIGQLIMVALLAFFARDLREVMGVSVGGVVGVALLALIPVGLLWWKVKHQADQQAWDTHFSGNENGK